MVRNIGIQWHRLIVILALAVAAVAVPAAEPAPPAGTVRTLTEFGPIATPAQAEATLKKAAEALIAQGGGILIIPINAPASWMPENITQGTWRTPPPPAPANKGWGNTPGITIIDYRGGTPRVLVQQMDGLTVQRDFRMPEGESCGHWGYFPMLNLQNHLFRGTTSYRDYLVEDVKAGTDRRFYVKTLRGIFPGIFVNAGDYGDVQRLYVKSIGYDTTKDTGYFVADTDADIPAGSLIHNKSHSPVLQMDTYAHTENQTFDTFIHRHHYSQGDTYLYTGYFNYMGDIHSTAGDENGVIYAAFSLSETNVFRGQVDTFTSDTHKLKYKGAQNAHTLATGRPIINLNPQKCITAGKAYIVNPGGALLGWGGSIRSKDAPWTADVVGRYFAIDEPDEYVPGSNKVRRWWLITRFSEKDGIKMISVQHHWWGAKDIGSISRLYNGRNFSNNDDNPKLLSYIIAPGANVYDVAEGVKSGWAYSGGALARTVKVTPGPHNGTPVDFAANDPIEQAIGPDPFKPIHFRSWLFDSVPGIFPSPVFDVANHGQVARYAVMNVAGGSSRYNDYLEPARSLPQLPWGTIWDIQSASEQGLVFGGDVENAVLLFKQPGNTTNNDRMQWMRWNTPRASMGVTYQGNLAINGVPLDTAKQGISEVKSLSATGEKSANLRGVNVPVPMGVTTLDIPFATPEPSAEYAVVIQPSWMTTHAIVTQTPAGLTIQFGVPAPKNARINWLLIR
ncbi:MAG: hypothetical protein ACYC7E_02495 [Armatimonadota bacterium]